MSTDSRIRERLKADILVNNPDMLVKFNSTYSFLDFLVDKVHAIYPIMQQMKEEGRPEHAIIELCLQELTKDLRPSKFQYVSELMQAEFPHDYERLKKLGVLSFECVNVVEKSAAAFETFRFSEETRENRFLRYAVIVILHEHFN